MSTERYWHDKEYADDIHNHLCNKEKKRYVFWGRSDLLSMRKYLVQWMKSVADKKGYCTTVQHLAVYLLDIFMDNHHCAVNHLKMATLSCLNIAVKLEDEAFAPTNSEYIRMLGNQYKLSDFVHMEVVILNFFNCSILFPTAAHFVEYYSLYALCPSDSSEGEPVHDAESLKVDVQKYIDYFLDLSLLDTVFYKFAPSLVAAACLLSARSCLSLSPPWPVILQNITCYKYGHVKPCMEVMLRNLNIEAVVTEAQKYVTPQLSISIAQE